MINPADMQNDRAFTPFLSSIDSNASEPTFGSPLGLSGSVSSPGDSIASLFPQFGGGPNASSASSLGLLGPLGGLLSQLGQMLQQLFSGGPGSGASQFGQNQQFFQSASGSSTGDPHLSFNGNTWNNMTSQPNLLDSNSFQGGFSIATQVTQPSAQGVTYNQQATITSNYGMNQVSLSANGTANITQNGQNVPISAGQTIDLGGGESVTQNQNGSLQVINNNGMGGSITTALSLNGQGVDVKTTANDVDLGGSLVQGNGSPQPPPGVPNGPWPRFPPTRQVL